MRRFAKFLWAVAPMLIWAAQASAASVTLSWTAPGDDSLAGQATKYEIRYRLVPMDNYTFPIGTLVPGTPRPGVAGTKESFTVNGLLPGITYYFAIKTQDDAGNWSAISNVLKKASSPVDVGDDPGGSGAPTLPLSFGPPRPNPAHDATSFAATLPRAMDVRVGVFDLQGRLVKTLLSGPQQAGETRVTWRLDDGNGAHVTAGIYLVRARLGDVAFERRVAVVQ